LLLLRVFFTSNFVGGGNIFVPGRRVPTLAALLEGKDLEKFGEI